MSDTDRLLDMMSRHHEEQRIKAVATRALVEVLGPRRGQYPHHPAAIDVTADELKLIEALLGGRRGDGSIITFMGIPLRVLAIAARTPNDMKSGPRNGAGPREENGMNPNPSVGRIVHYQSYGTPGGEHKSEPRAAVITAVREDMLKEPPGGGPPAGTPIRDEDRGHAVDLCVFNPGGLFFNRAVWYDESGKPGTWRWPPRV